MMDLASFVSHDEVPYKKVEKITKACTRRYDTVERVENLLRRASDWLAPTGHKTI